MNPLNGAERKQAFLNFLLFFVITVAVILLTVFFSVQVPFKENDKLRNAMDVAENEKLVMRSFEIKMEETMSLLDSINRAGNVYRVQNDINNNIKAMTTISDSSSMKTVCNKIIDNLTTLQLAKEQLRNVNNSSDELVKKDKRIEQLEAAYKTCSDQLQQFYLRLNPR